MYRVAIVDDEEIFLDFMEQAIDWAAHGCLITGRFTDGESALRYILDEKPDIVFIDISMQKISGLEVCRLAKEQGSEAVLVVMTAHDEFSFAYQALKLRLQDYLLKPFSRAELESVLKNAIATVERRAEGAEPAERQAVAKDYEGKGERLIESIESYIAGHYRESGFTINRMAEELRFENSYLRRVYKRRTGKTIAQRLDELRMEKAKELLAGSDMLNRDIAAAVGYSDQDYFSKRFKQLNGETPSAVGALSGNEPPPGDD